MSGEDLFVALVGLGIGLTVLVCTLWVLFGQITVRRLRKNPATKHGLGMEFYSGYDILNVAGALTLPRWMNRKLRSTTLAGLHADADVLYQHTSRLDRILARIFFTLLLITTFALLTLATLHWCGVFN